jgi:hypothetical protein
LLFEIGQIDELVRLPAKFICHHRGLGLQS